MLASLWNINDQSSAEIINSFYTYTSNGATKSDALRKAKLDYLSNHSGTENAPYYWASFVVIGNNTPLTSSSNILYWGIAIMSIILISLLFFKRRKKSSLQG